MVIELAGLGEGETNWRKTVKPEDIELAFPDFSFREPVTVQLSITHTESQYILNGRVATRAHSRCVKCLGEFDLPIEEPIGWAVQVVDDPSVAAKEEESEDFWFIERNEGQIKISARVREVILISLPANPVCRPDCRGLCPQCGADLNAGPCGCTQTQTDTRWAPLKDLLNRQPNRNLE